MIFNVTIVIILGHHEWCPYNMASLIDKRVCSDCSTGPSPISLPLLGPPYSLGHNNIEIRSISNPTMALGVEVKQRITHFSLSIESWK